MLKLCHHQFDSQKNESLNTKVVTVAPKMKTFCTTKSLEDRFNLVVILDSIGQEADISRVITELTGRSAVSCLSPIVRQWLNKQDRMSERKKQYRNKPETKKKRAKKIQEKIKQGIIDDKKGRKRGTRLRFW